MKQTKEITLRSSELNRRYLCPGSMHAENGLKESASRDMTLANKGTAGHTYLENWLRALMESFDLEDELPRNSAIETSEEMNLEIISGRMRRILLEFGKPDQMYLEKPLRIAHPSGDGTLIVVGRADVVLVYAERVIVVDYKSGWSDQLDAIDNLQLHSYLVGAMNECSRPLGIGFILSPMEATKVQIDGAGALLEVTEFISSMWEDCHEDGAQRIPGTEQCQYCKALGTFNCSETKNLKLPAIKLRDELDHYGGAEVAAGALAQWKLHEKVAERLKGLIKAALMEGVKIQGWELGKPRNMRSIPDATAAFGKLSAKGLIDPVGFAGCCNVSITALEADIKERTGSTKKGATIMLEETLGDALQRKESERPLKQSKAGF